MTQKKVIKAATILTWVLIVIILGILLSCSPYKQISRTPPVSTRDSNYLSGRCLSTFPIDTTGRTEFIILPQTEDSSEFYKAKLDSVSDLKSKVRDSVLVKYRDTCRSAIDQYEKGFDLGYAMGNYEGLKNRLHDTILKIRTETILDRREIVQAQTAATIAIADRDKYRGKWDRARSLNLWLLGIIIALVIVIFFLVKKKVSPVGAATSAGGGILSWILGLFKRKGSVDR